MCVGQALSVLILILFLIAQIKGPDSFFHFHYCLKTIFQFSLSLVVDHLVLCITLTASFDNWPYLSVFYPVTETFEGILY